MRLDPRTKIFIAFLFIINVFISTGIEAMVILFVLASLWLCFSGMLRKVFTYSLVLLLLLAFLTVNRQLGFPAGTAFHVLFIIKWMPAFMASTVLISGTQVSEILYALSKMNLPQRLIIPFAVMLRYIPSIHREFTYIRDAMKIRGIAFSPLNTFRHPLATMEYILVPLIMRSSRVADELSASVLARGINLKQQSSSFREISLTGKDVFVMGTGVMITAAIYMFDRLIVAGGRLYG